MLTTPPIAGSKPPPERMLFVSADRNPGVLPDLDATDLVRVISLPALNACCLADFRPDVVCFPLFSTRDDATSVIAKLSALGFRGRCLVLGPRLPKPEQIEAELRGLGPGLNIQYLGSDAPFNSDGPVQTDGLSRT